MKEWSFAEVLVAGILWLPWPLPYAQLVLEAVGTDLLEMHGGFLVTFHTPDHMKVGGSQEQSLLYHLNCSMHSNIPIHYLGLERVWFLGS